MAYAKRVCGRCGSEYRPQSGDQAEREVCAPCVRKVRGPAGARQSYSGPLGLFGPPDSFEPAGAATEVNWTPGQRLVCPICLGAFAQKEPHQTTHKACQGRVNKGVAQNPAALSTPYRDAGYSPGKVPPKYTPRPDMVSPLRIGVFDLETFALDRGWGVLLVSSILVFGDKEPREYTFTLPQFETYKTDRSNDSEICAATLSVLEDCHVWYAHAGQSFDVPWLNSIAMKYGLPPVERKLRDPVTILRNKFAIGSNSLQAASDFMGLGQSKIPVPAEVWRQAAFNGSPDAFETLVDRCRSDVELLAKLAARLEEWGGDITTPRFLTANKRYGR